VQQTDENAAAAKKAKAKAVKPPNKLASKVPKYGGKPAHLAIAEAEQRVENLKDDYIEHLKTDMAEVDTLITQYKQNPEPSTLKALFRVIHNMRGQAATFGYPLITQVGRSLCLYMLEQEERREEPELMMITLHIDALKVIYREQIIGTGDSISQETVIGLMKAVELKTGEKLLR